MTMPLPTTFEDAAGDRLVALIGGGLVAQAIAVAAELDLAERVADGPRNAAALSAEIGCDPDATLRLLRVLAAAGLFVERDGDWVPTEVGERLRASDPGSLRDWAVWCGRWQWPVVGAMRDSVRTGGSALATIAGRPHYARLSADPDAAATFNRAMTGLTRPVAAALAATCVPHGTSHVVDVGGGHGELLAAVLEATPASCTGTLLELPHAIDGARATFERRGLLGRATLRAGDFFESVPAGADLYLLKSVLHNWDDAAAARVLRCCASALRGDARLLVVERLLPGPGRIGPEHLAATRQDLQMLVGPGGRERTLDAYRRLLEGAGLRLVGHRPLARDFHAIEAAPA